MTRLSQSSIDRQQHIPPHIQQAMNQHMQGTMPAHLKRYMGEGAYVPAHAQKAINDHMQSTMPAHLKQYAGAYMEQQVLNPNATSAGTVTPPQPQAPVPDRMRLDHSNVSTAQYDAKFNTNLFTPDPQAPAATPPQQPQTQPQPVVSGGGTPPADPNSPDYGFIVQPPKPARRGLSLPGFSGGSSLVVRAIVVLGGLLVLLIIFAVIKSLLSGGGNTQALVTVAQDQQEMIHILTNSSGQNAQQQAVLSNNNQIFAATAQLSLTSGQTQLVTYLANNGKKVSNKTLSLKVSPAIDQQLTTAASNSTYDTTFQQIMQSKLTNYEAALGTAYKQTKGPKGRKLLINEYNGAKLLLTQLNSPAS